jgi:hypothetical protein
MNLRYAHENPKPPLDSGICVQPRERNYVHGWTNSNRQLQRRNADEDAVKKLLSISIRQPPAPTD